MIDYFPQALAFHWRPENDGQPAHLEGHDAGGWTAWGVTFGTWQSWCIKYGHPCSLDSFKALPKDQFIPFYRSGFWNPAGCYALGPCGVQVFDAAVMSSVRTAVRFLQHCLGVSTDGVLGPLTLAKAEAADQIALNKALTAEREAFYDASPDARFFGRGWDRRAEACRVFTAGLIFAQSGEAA